MERGWPWWDTTYCIQRRGYKCTTIMLLPWAKVLHLLTNGPEACVEGCNLVSTCVSDSLFILFKLCIETHTDTHKHTDWQTHSHAQTNTHTHSHTDTHTHTHTHSHTDTLTQAASLLPYHSFRKCSGMQLALMSNYRCHGWDFNSRLQQYKTARFRSAAV